MAKLKNKDLKAKRQAGIDPLRELLAMAIRSSRGFIGRKRAKKLEKMVDPICFAIELGILASETIGRPEFRKDIKNRWASVRTKPSRREEQLEH
jgi:hypothetical protein